MQSSFTASSQLIRTILHSAGIRCFRPCESPLVWILSHDSLSGRRHGRPAQVVLPSCSDKPATTHERARSTGVHRFAAIPKIEARQLCFHYGPSQALFDISMPIEQKCVTALIGPSGCGKEHVSADAQPDERPHRRPADHGPGADRRDRHLPSADRRGGPPQTGGHGVSEIEPVSQVDLRKRGLRPANRRRLEPGRRSTRSSSRRSSGPRCGRKSKTACATPPSICRAGSSSGCASPGPWPPIPKWC